MAGDFAVMVAWVDQDHVLNTAWASDIDRSRSVVAAPTPETAVGRPGLLGEYITWSGTDGDATINVAHSSDQVRGDPIVFQQKVVQWGWHAPAGPAIAYGNNRVYLAWADPLGALNLAWSRTPLNEESWDHVQLADSAVDAPSLSAGYGEDVWLAWAGTDGNGTLNVASGFRPGSERTYVKTVLDGRSGPFFKALQPAFRGADTSPSGPQLEVDDLGFTLAYAGHDTRIYLLSAFGGQFNRYRCADTSDCGVAVCGRVAGGGFAWRGLDGGHTLNTATNPFDEMGAVEAN